MDAERLTLSCAAITRSAILGVNTSGHLAMAWYETPIAFAAAETDPPKISMASDFFMASLNHSSPIKATIVTGRSVMFGTMVEYKDRLQRAMDERGVSARELADRVGMTYQAVKKVLDGKSAAFNAVNHAIVARYLDVRSDWLAIGDEPMARRGQEPAEPWPFPSIDERKVRSLPHDDKVRLDAALMFAASNIGLDLVVKKGKTAAA